MSLVRRLAIAQGLLLALMPIGAHAQHHVIDESERPTYLFVVAARSGTAEGGQLILREIPSVIYFSDRPARIAGHETIEAFVDTWDEGADSFAVDPPNAVLSILDPDGPRDYVVLLSGVELEEDALRFGYVIVEGDGPEGDFGPASLFVDCAIPPAGLSPKLQDAPAAGC